MGRTKNSNFDELKFQLVKNGDKCRAYCYICKKTLTNTAASRLKAHRGICKIKVNSDSTLTASSSTSRIEIDGSIENEMSITTASDLPGSSDSSLIIIQQDDGIPEDDIPNITLDKSGEIELIQDTEVFSLPDSTVVASTTAVAASFLSNPSTSSKVISKQPKRNQNLTKFIDKVSDDVVVKINSKLAAFFFGCNIPFNVVESDHFKNFIKILRPGYAPKLPGRKALSTTILQSEFSRCLKISSASIENDSVLLIDGWKNTSNNSKLVVSMIHNTGQSKAFLDAWDVTLEAETSEKLTAIVKESIVMAKNQYNTNIYAVVSDNAAAMLKMGRDVDIWHSNCSSHTGNLLTKDVMDVELNKKVLSVLKEFKHSNFEKALVDVGGSRIKTPVETRWCTYRDSYECLVFDDEFLDNVKDYILLFQPICSLINICQNPEVSIAESANLWLNLKLPSKFNELNLHLDRRREMACNLYTKCAYYLHPKFHDNAKKILSQNQLESISEFLINELDSEGLSSLSEFQESKGIFRALKNKQITDPIVFWNMAKIHHKSLANLAAKLMKIPASSATLERVFSNWSFVHSPLRNRLDFERSKKLLHIYYTHKIMDTNKCDDY